MGFVSFRTFVPDTETVKFTDIKFFVRCPAPLCSAVTAPSGFSLSFTDRPGREGSVSATFSNSER